MQSLTVTMLGIACILIAMLNTSKSIHTLFILIVVVLSAVIIALPLYVLILAGLLWFFTKWWFK